jgi:hypothetical protein
VCSRWVPRQLTDDHKEAHVATSLTLLQRYVEEGQDILGRVVTGDWTWLFHYSDESKADSMTWNDKPGKGNDDRLFGTCTESFWLISLLAVQRTMPIVIRAH